MKKRTNPANSYAYIKMVKCCIRVFIVTRSISGNISDIIKLIKCKIYAKRKKVDLKNIYL